MAMNSQRVAAAMQTLRSEKPVILPSLLQCDFGDLRREIELLEAAGVQALHLDVMDGLFVPNLSYGMPIVEGIRRYTDLPLDVHLMINRPGDYVQQFVDAGADCLTVHVEVEEDTETLLGQIRDTGVGVGLALNPATPLSDVEPFLSLCDLLLVMSVNAGFGGQSFNPVALEKLAKLKELAPNLPLEVDGGVNLTTIAGCSDAGATLLVAGSAIFGKEDYREAVEQLAAATGR